MYQNDISGWDWGVGAIYNSSPDMYYNPSGPPYRNSRIRNCNIGIKIYTNSYPLVGGPAQGSGFNSIFNNPNSTTPVNISFTSGGTLNACNTYWGGAAPTNAMFYLVSGSTIYTSNWLDQAHYPWAGLAKEVDRGGSVTGTETTTNNITANSSVGGVNTTGTIFDGIELRRENKNTEAKDFFIKYIASHPEDQSAYIELYKCYDKETAAEIISFFSSLPTSAAKEQKLFLSSLYLMQGDVETAKSINNTVADENPVSKVGAEAKMNNIYIAMYYENNVGEAVSLFNEIAANPKLSTYLELSLSHQAIESYADMNGLEKSNLASVPEFPDDPEYNMNSKVEATPDKYELFGSYPNPFNPVTTIKYALPQNSQVVLEVYSILGEKITTLVNRIEIPGNHEAVFDGSNLASGIYIYRITATSLETGEQFVKSAKMMMLK
jgi:hypothetical protein